MNKATVIIQARMGSSRLPGKIMYKLRNKPMLWHIVERIRVCKNVDDIIIATSISKVDDEVEAFAKKHNIKYVRGSEKDVLSRYVLASRSAKNDVLVRITADCPLIDPNIIDECINEFFNNECDYVAPTCRNGIIRGLDTEVFSKKTLIEVDKIAIDDKYREHVTLYIYSNPQKYRINKLILSTKYAHPEWRLCVDEIGDYRLIETIYNALYKDEGIIDIDNVIEYISQNEQVLEVNKNVKQKSV